MEADWEIEIGPDAPVIDAAWAGYIDLRSAPERVNEIGETAQFPALANLLLRLNSPASAFWTAKCDVWPVEEVDPDEMDANLQDAASAVACYIDLIPIEAHATSLEAIVEWCRRLCLDLRSKPLRQSRVDPIVRRAFVEADVEALGITMYVSACGSAPPQASDVLSRALGLVADSVLVSGSADQQGSKYNQSIVGE
jgi:hypothetical protein